jgi:hypothetical protein
VFQSGLAETGRHVSFVSAPLPEKNIQRTNLNAANPVKEMDRRGSGTLQVTEIKRNPQTGRTKRWWIFP